MKPLAGVSTRRPVPEALWADRLKGEVRLAVVLAAQHEHSPL